MTNLNATMALLYAILIAAALTGCSASPGMPPATKAAMPMQAMGYHHGDAGDEMMQSMAKMDRDMAAAPMNGNADHDFASMMIPHHQGAVDMAKVYLWYGKNPVLRRLAEEVVAEQPQEIAIMRQRLDAEPSAEAGGARKIR